jgi:hypothetical protein
MPTFNPFDQYGRVRPLDSEDDEAIETLPDNQRDALMACIAASLAADAGDDRLTAARADRANKLRAHDEALAADQKANPPITHAQALAAVSAANRPGYKPKPVKVNKETREALAAAVAALADARAEYHQAEVALKTLSTRRGEALLAYMHSGDKVTDEQIAREYQARSQAARLAIAERQAIADQTAPVTAGPVRLSKLDETMSARGKTANRTKRYLGPR